MKERIKPPTSFGRPGIRVRVCSTSGSGDDEIVDEEEDGDWIWVIAISNCLAPRTKWASKAFLKTWSGGERCFQAE